MLSSFVFLPSSSGKPGQKGVPGTMIRLRPEAFDQYFGDQGFPGEIGARGRPGEPGLPGFSGRPGL